MIIRRYVPIMRYSYRASYIPLIGQPIQCWKSRVRKIQYVPTYYFGSYFLGLIYLIKNNNIPDRYNFETCPPDTSTIFQRFQKKTVA